MTARVREARIPASEAPSEGSVRVVDVGGHRVGVYRVAGELYALADRCPHRGAPLCTGVVATPIETDGDDLVLGPSGSIVRCPWHKWEFDIATGRCLSDPVLRARRYSVWADGEEIVVTLAQPGSNGASRASAADSPGLG